MRRIPVLITCGLALVGCSKKDDTAGTGSGSSTATKDDTKKADKPADTPAVAAPSAVGVEAGGVEHDKDEGPAAVITGVSGTVEIKRVGEGAYAAAKLEDKLYSGDQLRTAEGSSATVALADESVVEVAEVTTIGIGSRDGTADPASSAAVLAGLARFSVASRTAGEGPFRVYTPQGVVMAKGTEYGVGVAASGEARVGVESGIVDVVGLAALDAEPITVETGNAATLEIGGKVGAPVAWPEDDWGTWRDSIDAKVEVAPALTSIGTQLASLDAQLTASYADLDTTAKDVATFAAEASASADKGDTATYEAKLPEGAATIDASFGLAGRVELLTWAYAGNATLASDIYVRHPEVETQYTVLAPHVDAAILWPKRFEVTATGYLEPLRTQYYVHHPRGRAHAAIVGVTVPTFYAKVEPPELEPVKVRAHAHTAIWMTPVLTYKASSRPVYVNAPTADWHVKVKGKVKPHAPRAKVAWYVRPPTLKSKLVLGGDVKGKVGTKLKFAAPAPRASIRAGWKVPVGTKVKIAAPDFKAAANARAKIKVGAGGALVVGPTIRDHRAGAVGGGIKAGVGGPTIRDHRDEVKGKVDGKVNGAVNGGVKGDAGVKVKIKAPPPPSVNVKVKAKGGIKF